MQPDHQPPHIVLTIDGLNTFMLGLYGNTTTATPSVDRLATSGITFDFCYSSSFDLEFALNRLFFGKSTSGENSITTAVEGASHFLSDCPAAIEVAEQAGFTAIETLGDGELPEVADSPAIDVGRTRAATFFAQATNAVDRLQPGDLLWLHFSGLGVVWDAPLALRKSFGELDDPDPYDQCEAPRFAFDATRDDPDLIVAAQQSCMAQVAVIDQMLGVFLDYLDQAPQQRPHLVFTSTRGFAFGQHGQVGIGNSLHSESTHVPLIVRNSGGELANWRSHQLIQTGSIYDWIAGTGDRSAANPIESTWVSRVEQAYRVFMPNPAGPIFFRAPSGQEAIQTDRWKLIRSTDQDGMIQHELYTKPDDRWEVSDVSSRCPDIVEQLEEQLRRVGC